MKTITRILAIIGALTVCVALYGIGLGIYLWTSKEEIQSNTMIEIDLRAPLVEIVPDHPLNDVMPGTPMTLRDFLLSLERAGDDDRVTGIIAKIGSGGMGFAKTQEIRDAIFRFRKKGKTAIAYGESFGIFSPGNSGYYLASAFERIFLQPSGELYLTGMMWETSFLKGTLEKLGIEPRLDHRKEYKNYKNIFTEKKFTPAHREANEALLSSLFEQMTDGIAEARGFTKAEVAALIDKGFFSSDEALEANLVDGVAYRDEVYKGIKKEKGDDVNFLHLSKYMARLENPKGEKETVALIYGVGGIKKGKNKYNPISGSLSMGSDTVCAAFRAAAKDKDVKAILFRIDSPGGSYIASDTIWREIGMAKKKGKPVIVSMGNVAASGGYFVAMPADKIVAEPGTITGSIGVVAGKMLTGEFWKKLGISWDSVKKGKNADFWTGLKDYSPEQWQVFQEQLDRIYDDFTQKVSHSRNIPLEKILKIAKGRVWSGKDAKASGLVDELGGFTKAVELVKKSANIPEDHHIRFKMFPRKKSLIDRILKRGGGKDEDQAYSFSCSLPEELTVLMKTAGKLEAAGNKGVLSIPDSELIW